MTNKSDSTPIVIIVIEGCADAIKKGLELYLIVLPIECLSILVYKSVVHDKIPVIFVEGTSGCCDLFAKCYHLYNGRKSKTELFNQTKYNSLSVENDEELKSKIREALQIVNHELAETSCTNAPDHEIDYFELIYECVTTRNKYLNFIDFKVHSLIGDDINLAILQALIK
ncbi:unnamed protein product, partial [Adineta steineri]